MSSWVFWKPLTILLLCFALWCCFIPFFRIFDEFCVQTSKNNLKKLGIDWKELSKTKSFENSQKKFENLSFFDRFEEFVQHSVKLLSISMHYWLEVAFLLVFCWWVFFWKGLVKMSETKKAWRRELLKICTFSFGICVRFLPVADFLLFTFLPPTTKPNRIPLTKSKKEPKKTKRGVLHPQKHNGDTTSSVPLVWWTANNHFFIILRNFWKKPILLGWTKTILPPSPENLDLLIVHKVPFLIFLFFFGWIIGINCHFFCL